MPDTITKVLKAIADPTRREIFHALVVASVAMPINQVSAQFEMTRQGVTKHLNILNDAGLITISTTGRERYCTATPAQLQEVKKWLAFYEQFWNDALDNLNNYLDEK